MLRKISLLLLVGVALFALSLGCGQSTEQDIVVDKAAFESAKGDSSFNSYLCVRLGYPADCDFCQEKGWYGDGECDTFCLLPDSDCLEEECDKIDYLIADCVEEGFGHAEDCFLGLDEDKFDLAQQCCKADFENSDFLFCMFLEEPAPSQEECQQLATNISACLFAGLGDPNACLPQPEDETYTLAAQCCQAYDFFFCPSL